MSWLGSIATHGTLKLDATKSLGVPEATVEQALSQMLTSGSLLLEEIDGECLIFLPHLRRAEEGIAAKVKSLARMAPLYPPIDFEKAVAWCEKRTRKMLAPSQREALKTAFNSQGSFRKDCTIQEMWAGLCAGHCALARPVIFSNAYGTLRMCLQSGNAWSSPASASRTRQCANGTSRKQLRIITSPVSYTHLTLPTN